MQRRDLLKRLPMLPFGIGAAVSQGPQIVARFFAGDPNELGRVIPAGMEEITFATRVQWFTNGINGWVGSYRPNVALPAEDAEWTPAVGRAVAAWSQYFRVVADSARDNKIPLDLAAEIADVPEAMLKELMH